VLAVIQYEQELAMAQVVEKCVAYRSLWGFSDADGCRDCQRHQIGRREGRQIGQPHGVRGIRR